MIPALESQLREVWDALNAGAPPRRVHIAMASHGDYPPVTSPLLFFLFADTGEKPVAVAKVARDARGDAFIEREIEALRAVHDRLPDDLRQAVPRVLLARPVNGRAAVLLSALEGESELHNTWPLAAARRRSASMRAALDWIHGASEKVSSAPIRGSEWFGMPFEAAATRLAQLGADARRHATRLAPLWDAFWPAGLVHGDYFPGNLLFDKRGAVCVVDWSTSRLEGPRCVDPITYELSFLAAALAAGRRLERHHVDEVHALPAFADEAKRWSGLGIDIAVESDARLATLVGLALRDGDPVTGRGPIGEIWARLLDWHLEHGPGSTAP